MCNKNKIEKCCGFVLLAEAITLTGVDLTNYAVAELRNVVQLFSFDIVLRPAVFLHTLRIERKF